MTERARHDTTWAKMPRQILYHPLLHKPRLLKVWLWCRLRAAYRPTSVAFTKDGVTHQVALQTGQFITSLRNAGSHLQLTGTQIQKSFQQLTAMRLLRVEVCQWYLVVTVLEEGLFATHPPKNIPLPIKPTKAAPAKGMTLKQATVMVNGWVRKGIVAAQSQQMGIGVDAQALARGFTHHLTKQQRLPETEQQLMDLLNSYLMAEWV